ncbi:hypothetical protein CRENBAI_009638 [Crenichthys baileyi]|uniref:Chemokine interleukin-8-like domain-containing protein n=1 Tax=Crenichthys baileyi TaxID=28760 RepID=A0AAV9RB22_9TELE
MYIFASIMSFILFLLVTLVLPTFSAQGISKCCLKYPSTKVHRSLLKSYYFQDSSQCDVPAVVFTTFRGKRICADPSKVRTKTSMAYLDGKNCKQTQTTSKQQQEDWSN